MQPCIAALEAFKSWGKEFLAGMESTQQRCAAQVQAARDACRQRQANCEALEEAALKCLGSRMRAKMSMSGDKLPWREAELRRRESEASLAASQAEAAARTA